MNKPCKELKRIARENLNRRYSAPMSAFMLTQLLVYLVEMPFAQAQASDSTLFQTTLFYLALIPIQILQFMLNGGIYRIHLGLAREKPLPVSQLFFYFTHESDHAVKASAIMTGLQLPTMIPFFVGFELAGHHATANYYLLFALLGMCSLCMYMAVQIHMQFFLFVMIDKPHLSMKELFSEAVSLTKGRRRQLLYMYLSFLGMDFLAACSLGLGLLWVAPYQTQTVTNFYLDVKGELPAGFSEEYKSYKEQYRSFNDKI